MIAQDVSLPIEVLELIIDEVSLHTTGRFTALKACALTCRDFLSASQRHIFHTVHLTKYPIRDDIVTNDKYFTFYEALSLSPELARYVYEVIIYDECREPAIVAQPTLPKVLGMLHNMAVFDLGFANGRYHWNHFSTELKRALVSIFLSPVTQILRLTCIKSVPPAFARWITCVPKLELSWIRFSELEDKLEDLPTHQPLACNLKELTICGLFGMTSRPLLEDVLQPTRCKLEKLTVSGGYRSHNCAVAQRIMNRMNTSITTIECLYYLDDGGQDELDIGVLPNLHSIKILAHPDSRFRAKSFERFIQILSKAKEGNAIREVTLTMMISNQVPDTSDIVARYNDCRRVDMFLSGNLLSKLQKFHVVFPGNSEGWFSYSNANESALQPIGRYFPQMDAKGILLE